MVYDNVSAPIALAGSTLSAITTFIVLVCFAIWHRTQRSFRHALVFNLALSDFINSFTNTISGAIYIRNHKLLPGPACTVNGWIEQLSVQATDFSILAIGLVTLMVVRQKDRVTVASTRSKTLICLSVWIIPLITSTLATAMGAMQPVSGNWCWIARDRIDLRYSLTHGWRFAIMLTTIIIYTYIWWYLSNFSRMLKNESFNVNNTRRRWYQRKNTRYLPSEELQENHGTSLSSSSTLPDKDCQAKCPIVIQVDTTITSHYMQQQTKKSEREIKHMLLLNGYPIMYIILWIPSILNRVFEATGSKAISSRALGILQAPAQFVGFANAVTYSLNLIWRERGRGGVAR
ncbi:hypothetical protein NHQ30_000435 [Ciborinia camelliae]|nr:hypothetical protein NHQ30_000435 [Ciborinia camelliae]